MVSYAYSCTTSRYKKAIKYVFPFSVLLLSFSNIMSISGPDKWHKDFPVAKEGKRQSPIDLKNDVEVEKQLSSKLLAWNYVPANNVNIENTGASWKVNVQSNKESGKYQMHF